MVATELPAGCILHGVPYGQMCFACMPVTYWPAAVPAFPPLSGWVCPQCSRSIAPSMQCCPFCVPQVVITSRQSGDRMVPVDPPEPVPRTGENPGPDRCPECCMPLTMHHEPGCSKSCGQCEERKARDAEEARRTIRLPGYMSDPDAVQLARVTTVWAEVFPGLEASLRSVRTGVAEVDFRITAQEDGQARD